MYKRQTPAYFWEMQELGLLRGDLRFEVIWPAPYLVMTARMSYTPGPVPVIYERDRPLVRAELDGVTLVGLYGFPEQADAGTMSGRSGGGDADP